MATTKILNRGRNRRAGWVIISFKKQNMIQRFKKKPVVINAVQWNGDNEIEIMDFVGKKLKVSKPPSRMEHDYNIPNEAVNIFIPTMEGEMTADRYDYIIKGVAGEFYPCKPDIFKKTYSKVKELVAVEMPEFIADMNEFKKQQKQHIDELMDIVDDWYCIDGSDEDNKVFYEKVQDAFILRKLNSEQNVQASVATDDGSSTKAD